MTIVAQSALAAVLGQVVSLTDEILRGLTIAVSSIGVVSTVWLGRRLVPARQFDISCVVAASP